MTKSESEHPFISRGDWWFYASEIWRKIADDAGKGWIGYLIHAYSTRRWLSALDMANYYYGQVARDMADYVQD